MALAISPPSEVELTRDQKYQRFRERARVEVKLISKAGAEPRWLAARIIQKPNKGGAMCRWAPGLERFFHWNEIRPPRDDFDPAKPFGSLGEIAKGTLPALRAVPPYLDTEPAPPPAAPASTPAPDPVPTNQRHALITSEALRMAEKVDIKTMRRAVPLRSAKQRRPSVIGEFLFEERRRRGWNQNDVAKHVSGPSSSGKIYNTRISRIEMGATVPTDDELLAFADLYKVELDELMRMRSERPPRKASEIAAAVEAAKSGTRPIVPIEDEDEDEPEPVRAAPMTQTLTSRPAPPSTQPALQSMAAFMDAIGSVCPLPLDAEKRRAWVGLVIELYQLNGSADVSSSSVVSNEVPQPNDSAKSQSRGYNGRGESRAMVLAAAEDWSTSRAIRKRCPGLTAGTVQTLISALAKEGLLERRGKLGDYEYRRARKPGKTQR